MTKPVTVEQARTAYAKAGSYRAAGAALGISGQRVQKILATNGGAPQTLTVADRAILDALFALAAGPSKAQIAERMGVTSRAIAYRLARLSRANLITSDAEGGYVPTVAARTLIAAVSPQGDQR